MRTTATLAVAAAALLVVAPPAGAARGGDPIYKPGARYCFYSRAWSEGLEVAALTEI